MFRDGSQSSWGLALEQLGSPKSQELEKLLAYWRQPPEVLIPDLKRRQATGEYVWSYKPINIAIGKGPSKNIPLQQLVLDTLLNRLTHETLGNKLVELPGRDTPQERYPNMVIWMGDGKLGEYQNSFRFYLSLPNPKPLFFYINTVEDLPDNLDRDTARTQIVRGAAHNGVILEGKPQGDSISKALWISMQKNRGYIYGTSEEIISNIMLRILYHYGAEWVTKKSDFFPPEGESLVSWDDWYASSVHQEMWRRAQALAQVGLIQDQVNLRNHANRWHVRMIELALNKSAWGESMRAKYLSQLGLLAVTPSGSGKVQWDPDPIKHHLVPVSHITRDGYAVPLPGGAPLGVKYVDGSVETHQCLKIVIALQLAKMGIANTIEGVNAWLEDQYSRYGMAPVKISDDIGDIDIEHIHRHPKPGSVNNRHVETLELNLKKFPPLDGPCGDLRAADGSCDMFLQSDAFKNRQFRERPFGGKSLVGIEPGHGMLVLGESSQATTDAILEQMDTIEPPGV